jgi:hypothetical protein
VQRKKHELQIVATDGGRQSDPNDEQPEKADSPRNEAQLPASNSTVERLVQRSKQDLATYSSDAGREIDVSDGHDANADSPIS